MNLVQVALPANMTVSERESPSAAGMGVAGPKAGTFRMQGITVRFVITDQGRHRVTPGYGPRGADMPATSHLGRLITGAGVLGMSFAATAGLAAPAQAVAHHHAASTTAGLRAARGSAATEVRRALPAILPGRHLPRSPALTVTPRQTLEPGQTLPSGQALKSRDGHFTLTMQANGNLVYTVTGTTHRVWASGTAGHAGAYLTMLSNGNLVLYTASGVASLWSSKTSGHGPARLVAQVNGDLVIYQRSAATWRAGSYDPTLEPGESLRPGWSLNSGRGYRLTMRKTGNLAETGPGGATWSSKTSGHAGATATMRASGNLAVSHGTTWWSTRTSGHRGARLVIQPSGVLAVRRHRHTLWASRKTPAPPPPLTLGQWPGRAGTAAAARKFGYPYPHPPACTHGGRCEADKWAFYRGQCTSWVAYRLTERSGVAFSNSYGGPGRWGNAVNWGPRARKLKIKVSETPTVGSIAWYGATKAAPHGHVAYVEKVRSPTSIVMSEMNYDSDNGFWVHTITWATGDWPTSFIHLADR